MRIFALLLLTAAPAFADTIEAPGAVTAVTLYPAGATVTRTVSFSAPAGIHEIIIPGLPRDTRAEALRIRAPEGVTVGAVSLATGRQPATTEQTSPEVQAAKAEVERLELVVEERRRAIAAIGARTEAARARVAFLQSLATTQAQQAGTLPSAEALRALAALVGEEVRGAREEELAANAETAAAMRAMQPEVEALARAQAALAALTVPQAAGAPALVLNLQTGGGEVALEVDALAGEAGWTPVYDLRLTRNPDRLAVARGVSVWQATGEDWRGIALTLSTARPSEQSAPSVLYPELRAIYPEPPPMDYSRAPAAAPQMGGMAAPPAAEADMAYYTGFSVDMQGTVFNHRFGNSVDIRSGADNLRLTMDEQVVEVELRAEAVPMLDATAYLVATLTNTTGQPLLPGPATLYAEGALVGGTGLALIPPQGEATIGFGAIDGLRLTRTVPSRRQGEEGIITTGNRIEEVAEIRVENLTGESWPLRVIDRIPYSQQDDLTITTLATPPATRRDPEGQRGLMEWDFDLAPGAERVIRLETRIAWPRGMLLR